MQSQAAYELAVKGPIRPADFKVPMIYSIKCIDFEPPEFTLGKYHFEIIVYIHFSPNTSTNVIIPVLSEIVSIIEDDEYLKSLIGELGFRLKSSAYCSYIQCSQFGLFNVKDALLSKHWDLQNILDNMSLCHKILAEHPYMLNQEHPHLVEQTAQQ